LISARIGPSATAPVANNNANVKPLDVATAMITISRHPMRGGRRSPTATAMAAATTMPTGRPTSAAASSAHVPVP
jgi:hypothetical protein